MQTEESLALTGLVTGRVQGVYFRAETRSQAQQLGLTGWVRNTRDGRVELLIAGKLAAIDKMRAWLARGPTLARVESLQLEEVADPGLSDFQIRY